MQIKQYVKLLYIRWLNRNKKVRIEKGAIIGIETVFSGYNYIGQDTEFSGKIGVYSYIARGCTINADVGKFCSIAENVRTITASHPTRDFVSSSPVFYLPPSKTIFRYSYVDSERWHPKNSNSTNLTRVGNDVWIGYGVTILPGVTIGDGAIIGACSVVTNNVAPYSIVAGVPAKEIRKRFSDDQILRLLTLRWWDKDSIWLKTHADQFENIDILLSKGSGKND